MSFWRGTAARGGGYDGQAMNVACSSLVILSRAAGDGPRKHFVTVRIPKKDPTAGARSLSVLWRIGVTAALFAT